VPVAPGVTLWPGLLSPSAQRALVQEAFARAEDAPFYRPVMPRSGKPFSVLETNFGRLGWYSDIGGYRYTESHPQTRAAWPSIPEQLLELWRVVAPDAPEPECCLVNLYREGARMGLHQDRDEEDRDAPVVSVSLGDEALFRIGGLKRKDPTLAVKLASGDVITFGGPARLAFHGIDRVVFGTSEVVPGGGRLNFTLRRVTGAKKDARPGG